MERFRMAISACGEEVLRTCDAQNIPVIPHVSGKPIGAVQHGLSPPTKLKWLLLPKVPSCRRKNKAVHPQNYRLTLTVEALPKEKRIDSCN